MEKLRKRFPRGRDFLNILRGRDFLDMLRGRDFLNILWGRDFEEKLGKKGKENFNEGSGGDYSCG